MIAPYLRQKQMAEEAQLAAEVAFVRRRLSFTAVQQQARLLLDRLQLLGEGAGPRHQEERLWIHGQDSL